MSLVQLIVAELKTTPLGAGVDITKCNDKLIQVTAKLNKNTMDQINTILQGCPTFLKVCISNIQEILKDNQISVQDTPYFLNIIKTIHDEATQFTRGGGGITISVDTMFTMCDVLINILLVLTVQDPVQLDLAQKLTDSALTLAQFSPVGAGSNSLFKCC